MRPARRSGRAVRALACRSPRFGASLAGQTQAIVDVDRRLARANSEERDQFEARLGERELGGPNACAILQHGDTRPRDFQGGDGSGRHAAVVEVDEPPERLQVVLCERQSRLGLQNVDAGQRDVQLQTPCRV